MTPTLRHIEGKKDLLSLHPIYEAIVGMEEYLNDPILMKYSEQRHRGHTPEATNQYVKSFDHYDSHIWKIVAPTGEFIRREVGTITAYRDRPNGTANVGILVWSGRKGFGVKAWKLVCDWLLSDGTRKIEAGTMAANIPMLRTFARTGMHIEATIKDHFLLDGKPTDLIMAARFK